MINIDDAADLIIQKQAEAGQELNLLKLQKLLYYVQAWHLAFGKGPLFGSKFQAWVHGPVNREVYNRFAHTHMLYSPVLPESVRPGFNPASLPAQAVGHIAAVLESYGQFSGSQLEELTHQEEPWQKARAGLAPSAPGNLEIDDESMRAYYAKRLAG